MTENLLTQLINATYAVAFILPRYITNQFNDQLPVGNWLERCTGIAEVRVRIPASLIFSGFLFATAY